MFFEFEEAATNRQFDTTTIASIGTLIAVVCTAIGSFLPKLSKYLTSRGEEAKKNKAAEDKARESRERRDWSNQTIMLDRLQDEFNELKIEVKALRSENLECETRAAAMQEKINSNESMAQQQRDTIRNQGQEVVDLRNRIKHLETLIGKPC